MDYTSAFMQALNTPPILPEAISPAVFLGHSYFILEETTHDFLTIHSGGIVEAREQYSFSMKTFPFHMLLYTKEGSGVLRAGGRNHILTEQTLLYYDCASFPTWEIEMTESFWRYNVFFLTGSGLSAYAKLKPDAGPLLIHVDPYGNILPCIDKLLSRTEGTALYDKLTDDMLLHRILTELWISALSLAPSGKDCPAYLMEIKYSMDTFFMNDFSLQELEARYHVNKYRICREFAAAYGMPPLKYLNKRRLDAATQLLLSTNRRVHEISLEVGFETTNHFINLFKREMGTTPQAYRNANNNIVK